jgi:hypothetical protein
MTNDEDVWYSLDNLAAKKDDIEREEKRLIELARSAGWTWQRIAEILHDNPEQVKLRYRILAAKAVGIDED